MARQAHSKKLAWSWIPGSSVQRHHVARLLFATVKPGTKLHTDGALIYKGIEQWWPVTHQTDIHRKFQFGKTSQIEGMFGNLRTFIRRMYHHATTEHMPEYVGEFCARFSHPEIFDSPLTYLKNCLPPVPID